MQKCLKYVTSKTLKYSHKKTCTGEEPPVPKPKIKPKQETVQDIEDTPIKQLPLKPTIKRQLSMQPAESTQQLVEITVEMYRNYKNKMRTEEIKQLSQKLNNLFMNSF